MEKLLMDIDEIGDASGESRSNIVRAIKAGHLRSIVVGKRRKARPEWVREWVDFQRESDGGTPVKYQARPVVA